MNRVVGALMSALLVAGCATPASDLAGPESGRPSIVASSSDAALGEHGGGPPASVVFFSNRDGNTEIYVMNADGSDQRRLTNDPAEDTWPDISPNGRYVVFASARSGNRQIYVVDLESGALLNVSNSGADDNWPRWSPNGHQIAFHSNRDGNYELYIVNADGSGLRRITSDPQLDQWPDWSPDGKRIAFRRGVDVYVIDADGQEQNVRRLTNLPTIDQMPVWSPNGKQIAFMSAREGYPSVFLMSDEGDTPEHPAVNLTPKDAGDASSAWLSRAPAWSMDGRHIYFMSKRPSTGGDVELFVMNLDGSGVERLTYAPGEDGGPQTR